MRIVVINGPNLNLLGTRQPEIYGSETLADLEIRVRSWAERLGVAPELYQSNDESALVELIQKSADADGVVINPGGYTHTSVAIADAIASIPAPVVEVHLSDIERREAYRRVSLLAPNVVRRISGRGITGYRDAIRHLVNRARMPFDTVRYGPHDRNVADHRTATGGRRRLIILVHGGFWYGGWDRDQLDSAAIDLTARGFDTLNVEYRLDPPWPGSGHDVGTAVGWAMSRYDSIGLVGHSAGGFLAIWNQGRTPVDVCVGLAAITDLRLIGGIPARDALKAAGGPEALDFPAGTVLFHGRDDDEVSPEHSTRAGDAAAVHVLDGVGHYDLVNPQRPHWQQVVSTLGHQPGL